MLGGSLALCRVEHDALQRLLSCGQRRCRLGRIGFGVAGVTREFVTAELESGAIRELKTDFEIPPRSVDMCTLRDVPPSAATARFTQEVARRVQTEERG